MRTSQRRLDKSLAKQGMTILTGAGVESLKADAKGVAAKIKTKDGKVEEKRFSHCIVAVGIVPNTENIGLEKLGIKTDQGPYRHRRHVPHQRARHLGDRRRHRAALAGAQGEPRGRSSPSRRSRRRSATRTSTRTRWTSRNIPGCTYCHPQVASVGLTEAKAKEAGHEVKVGKFPFIGNGKAIALGEAEGFVKTVFDAKTGELLGAHMIGAEVTELIQGYTVGKTAELVEQDFINTVFPHPTLSEMMHESVLAAYGRVMHI